MVSCVFSDLGGGGGGGLFLRIAQAMAVLATMDIRLGGGGGGGDEQVATTTACLLLLFG